VYAVDYNLRHVAAANDDRLGAVPNRVRGSTLRAGIPGGNVVRQLATVFRPWIRDFANRVISRIIYYRRAASAQRYRVGPCSAEGVLDYLPTVRTAGHGDSGILPGLCDTVSVDQNAGGIG